MNHNNNDHESLKGKKYYFTELFTVTLSVKNNM